MAGTTRWVAGLLLVGLANLNTSCSAPEASLEAPSTEDIAHEAPVDRPSSEPPLDPKLALEAHDLKAWRNYPEADTKAIQRDLEASVWLLATVDLACAGSALHGNPEAHSRAAGRILGFHKTTAAAVMNFGAAINRSGQPSGQLGPLAAQGAARCP